MSRCPIPTFAVAALVSFLALAPGRRADADEPVQIDLQLGDGTLSVPPPTQTPSHSILDAPLDPNAGLLVIVEASQRPLDGVFVLPPTCGPFKVGCALVREVLHNDMRLSGVVRALELSENAAKAIGKHPVPHFAVDLKAARASGVIYAVGARVRKSRRTRNSIELEVQAVDVRTGALLPLGPGGLQVGRLAELREMVHQASNALFGALTGVEGSFADRIAYSAPGPGCTRCIWMVDADGHNARIVVGDEGIHMLPRPTVDLGLTYVSFRGDLPSLFRVTGPQLGRLWVAAEPPAPAPKRPRQTMPKPSRANSERVSSAPFARGEDLQFRTAAQSAMAITVATINNGEQADLWLLDPDGKPIANLTNDESDDLGATWSPDTSHIAFVSNRSGTPQVYVMKADGSDVRRLTFAGPYNTDPDWGPDGRIVFSGLRGRAVDILTVNLAGQLQRLTPGKGRRSLEPSWASCGKRVVYVSDEDGGGPRLWIASHDGAVREPLALPAGRYYTPTWIRKPGAQPRKHTP